MLAFTMGLGKTAIVATAVEQLIAVGAVNKVLVVAPKRVAMHTWPTEIAKWTSTITTSVVCGDIKKKSFAYTKKKREVALAVNADVYCINYEGLMWLAEHLGDQWPFDMVVADESSMLKHHGSNRSKVLRRAVDSGAVKRMVQLTGTPASNGIGDLWAQVRLLDGGKRLYSKIGEFRARWLEQVGEVHHNRWGVKGSSHLWYATKSRNRALIAMEKAEDAGRITYAVQKRQEVADYDKNIADMMVGIHAIEEEITDEISDICFSLNTADLISLPPVTFNDIKVTLPPRVMEQYRQFEEEFLLEFPEGGASSPNAAAAAGKCMQLANGAVYLDDTEGEWAEVHTDKLDALGEVIEEAAGSPVLIWYNFQSDRDRILKRFKQARHIDDVDLDEWNRGLVPAMVSHPKSGAHGLNIQYGGHISCWFSLGYDLELQLQADARLHRDGQTDHVFIHRIVAEGTLDEDVIVRLAQKAVVQDSVLKRLEAA